MAVFKNREMMEKIFEEIFNEIMLETELGIKLKQDSISVLYKITDPDVSMYIDGNGVIFGKAAEAKRPAISENMSGDTAHNFWLKKLDLPKALASRQIRAKGSATKLLRLLPLLRVVQEVYPEYCRQHNLPMDK